MNFSPVFWFQGLFLQPQHFQQQEIYLQKINAYQLENFNYYWGISELKFRKSSLVENLLEIEKVKALFPDKTYVDYPQNAILRPRSLKNLDGTKETLVYLGLKKLMPDSSNVTEDIEEGVIGTRFVSSPDPRDVKDIYLADSPVAKVRFLQYVLNIFFEEELESLNDYYLLPLAKVKKEEKGWTITSDFLPPLLNVKNFSYFSNFLLQLKEHILSKLQTLEGYKLNKDSQSNNFEIGYLRYLLALLVLNRNIPLLEQFIQSNSLHPFKLYSYLSQLVGELSTFTDRINALGITSENKKLLTGYQHNNLYQSFSELILLLEELLDAIVIGAENILRLTRKEDLFEVSLPLNLLQDKFNYCLVITTQEESSIPSLESLAKISTSSHLETLIARALPGLPFFQRTSPPPGLPKKEHTYFFVLEKDSKIWPRIKESGDLALYWENAPEDASVDLVISKL